MKVNVTRHYAKKCQKIVQYALGNIRVMFQSQMALSLFNWLLYQRYFAFYVTAALE